MSSTRPAPFSSNAIVHKHEWADYCGSGECPPKDEEGFCCENHTRDVDGRCLFYRVNMAAFEASRAGAPPVYTSDKLREWDALRQRAEADDSTPQEFYMPDINGTPRCVWQPYPKRFKMDIEYLPYPALSPDFNKHGCPWGSQSLVNAYNHVREGDTEYIPLPMVLDIAESANKALGKTEEKRDAEMDCEFTYFQLTVQKAEDLWPGSVAARALEVEFERVAEKTVQIKKIVGLGLGTTDVFSNPGHFTCHFQHLALITMAEVLNRSYRAKDPSMRPIDIVLQDPEYESWDKEKWCKKYGHTRFVQNPHGFLEIDENTLVVSAFLPFSVPLLPMIMDLLPNGPAGIIHPHINLDATKRFWAASEAVTPKVVKWLQKYEASNFDQHPVDRVM